MLDCPCQREPALCDRCLDARFAQLRGVAACRGGTLRDELLQRRIIATIDHARARVADLSRDARLRELLAVEALAWARKPATRVRIPMSNSFDSGEKRRRR